MEATMDQVLSGTKYKRANDPLSSGLFGIVAPSDTTTPAATITFYIGYSTWEGKVLYVNKLPESNHDCLLALAKIAVAHGCRRLVWQSYSLPPTIPSLPKIETLNGWLTLFWERDAMQHYAGGNQSLRHGDACSSVSEIFTTTLSSAQPFGDGSTTLQLAQVEHLDDIVRLVQGLADYENEPEAVRIGKKDYRNDGFANNETTPCFYCVLLQHDNVICGMAFCYIGHTVSDGSYLYLEDLFIEKDYRGKGFGQFIMRNLCRVALQLNCSMRWQALDWNGPALAFYNKIGAKVQQGFLTHRFAGDTLLQVTKSSAT